MTQKNSYDSVSDFLKFDYYQKVSHYLFNKEVLDVGCVEHDIATINQYRPWNHWFMNKVAKKVTGIDIEVSSIKRMQQMGFNVKLMSAEQIIFKEKFDVIFGGEVIEHLANPGLFLTSAQKVLKSHGIIVLTTPNTYSGARLFRVFQMRSNEPPVNPDHTVYFSPQTITTLAAKCGLKVSNIDYAHFPFTHAGILEYLNSIVCRIVGKRFKEQMIVVMRRA